MDKGTKILLAVLAAAMWADALTRLATPVRASNEKLELLMSLDLSDIKSEVHAIAGGTCLNPRLCYPPR